MRQITDDEYAKLMRVARAARSFRSWRKSLHAAYAKVPIDQAEVRATLDGGVTGELIAAIDALDHLPDATQMVGAPSSAAETAEILEHDPDAGERADRQETALRSEDV